jgi:hypothetical protein
VKRPSGPAPVFSALLLSAALPLAAQVEIALHGTGETLHAAPFSSDRNLSDSRTAFTGEISAFAGDASAFVSLSAEYNAVSPDRAGFSLGEAWFDWARGGFSLRMGRQLFSWGAADGLILTDVVCPQNLSAYAGLDFTGSRLPVDGLRLRYSFTALTLEGVWLPLFTPARLPQEDNPLYAIFYPSSVEMGGTRIPVSIDGADPPRTIAGGEYGLRASAYTSALDFSFMAFYGWNDIPWVNKEFIFQDDEIRLAAEYGRTLTLGADASIPLGEILLRFETAWIQGGRYERPLEETAALLLTGRRDSPVEKQNLKILAGLDWNPAGWTLSVQYLEDLLPDAFDGGTERSWRKNGFSFRLAKSFFRETLSLSAWSYLDLMDFDTANGVSAAYALTDALSFSLGSDFFTGGIDDRGSYAAYKDLSCVWIKGIFRF